MAPTFKINVVMFHFFLIFRCLVHIFFANFEIPSKITFLTPPFFQITGIIILSVGASIKAYYDGYSTFLDTKYFSTPNLLIAIGTIVFIVAFFGCCGAVKENFCMVVTVIVFEEKWSATLFLFLYSSRRC